MPFSIPAVMILGFSSDHCKRAARRLDYSGVIKGLSTFVQDIIMATEAPLAIDKKPVAGLTAQSHQLTAGREAESPTVVPRWLNPKESPSPA